MIPENPWSWSPRLWVRRKNWGMRVFLRTCWTSSQPPFICLKQLIDQTLANELEDGSIFTFPLNYRADYRAETAFLLKNTEGYFCVVGVPTVSEWCEQEKPAIEKLEEEEDSDDLDFDMF